MDPHSASSSSPVAVAPPPPGKTMPTKARTLVLCFDGTANQFDGENTNIVKFYALLKKDATEEQLCYYQPGIGTYFQPGVVSPLFQWCAKILDEAVAWYLDAHVRGGYQFLMQNWKPGDKICIFGFSRGAYTARALAGMLHKIGLLPKDNPEQVPFAYKLFKKTDAKNVELAQGFKETFCRDVSIDFVGVWDTVASVGVITGPSLPFTTANTTIKVFRHALALDERRVKFLPNRYHKPAEGVPNNRGFRKRAKSGAEKTDSKFRDSMKKLSPANSLRRATMKFGSLSRKGRRITEADLEAAKDLPETRVQGGPIAIKQEDDEVEGGTDCLEVWFAGCHSDVGGGAVPNSDEHCLADITLRWMVRQIVLSQCGITFDSSALSRAHMPDSVFAGPGFALSPSSSHHRPHSADSLIRRPHISDEPRNHSVDGRLSPSAAGPSSPPDPFASPKMKDKAVEEVEIHTAGLNTRAASPTETALTEADEVCSIHDQLKAAPLWWILEIIPLIWSTQDAVGNWKKTFGFHGGRGRPIPDEHPVFHESVKDRMADPNLKYKPKAKYTEGSETYCH